MKNYINLDNLPKKNDNDILWTKSIGHEIEFCYNGILGKLVIINNINNLKVSVLYNDKIYNVYKRNIIHCNLCNIIDIVIPYKYNVGEKIFDKNRKLIILECIRKKRKNIKSNKLTDRWYRCKCFVCGSEEAMISESHLNQNRGCPVCHSKQISTGVNDIPTTDPWMIPYFQGGYDEAKLYTKCSESVIYPICPDCGNIRKNGIKINQLYKTRSINCSCSDKMSYPNKFANNMLSQLGIKYKPEYSPDWIKPKRYDFYFEIGNQKYIIEMDGALGHGGRAHSKSNLSEEELLDIDKFKDKKAIEHNVEVIRIDCLISDLNYIKTNIINSKLANILNLSMIKWENCDHYAIKNIVKEVCDFKSNHLKMSASDIAPYFNIDRTTVARYLIKGEKYGWCRYNGNAKFVEISKDNILLGEFKSAKVLSEQSEKLFGILLNKECIKRACRNEVACYKGYNFRYIE